MILGLDFLRFFKGFFICIGIFVDGFFVKGDIKGFFFFFVLDILFLFLEVERFFFDFEEFWNEFNSGSIFLILRKK